jgi:transcriptional regulator with XRE-family HTH domain
MVTLGQAIQQARIAQRLKQKDLVEKTGISQKYLSQIEHDRVDPSYGKVRLIARALKVSLDPLKMEEKP